MDQITFFGETNFRNQKVKFGIKTDDRRRHIYIVGKTGMGKTTLLENMVASDILNGNGLAFIDPHGESAEKILSFVPTHRINDVVYFNPADLDYPIAFNILEQVPKDYRHLVASGLMGIFKKIWPDVWSARMEYILNNTILALLEYPNATLLGVNRMLADKEFRKVVVDKITDPVVKSFWTQEFAKYTQKLESEATAAIQNKIGQFISAPIIRNIIGQVKSSINMRELMDQGKILIVNLSKGKVGEDNSRLIGAMIITKLQIAAMSRVDIPENQRKDFYLYVDEFQNFATASFVNILSEARKYHLCLTLAHQYIDQMEEVVRNAIFGNVGTIIVFRVGAKDAEVLEKEFSPEFMATDLVNLGFANIYLKLMIDGVASRPFSAVTLPPYPKPENAKEIEEKIIKVSRERYAKPREEVEEKLSRWLQSSGEIKKERQEELKNEKEKSITASYLFDAVCSSCDKPTKTIFEPDGIRPVYCKNCLKDIKAGKRVPVVIQRQSSQDNKFQKSSALKHSMFNYPNQTPSSFKTEPKILKSDQPPVSLKALLKNKPEEPKRQKISPNLEDIKKQIDEMGYKQDTK